MTRSMGNDQSEPLKELKEKNSTRNQQQGRYHHSSSPLQDPINVERLRNS